MSEEKVALTEREKNQSVCLSLLSFVHPLFICMYIFL